MVGSAAVEPATPADRFATVPTSIGRTTRVGRGVDPVRNLDERRWEGRRLRELYDALVVELGREPRPFERSLLTQAAAAALNVELMAGKLAAGEEIDQEQFIRGANAADRALRRLGLDAFGTGSEAQDREREQEDREAGLIP